MQPSWTPRLYLYFRFHRDVDEICALLGYYAASCGNCLPTRCPETSVDNYHMMPRNIPEERRSQLICTWYVIPITPLYCTGMFDTIILNGNVRHHYTERECPTPLYWTGMSDTIILKGNVRHLYWKGMSDTIILKGNVRHHYTER
jgi:hypothetical protein